MSGVCSTVFAMGFIAGLTTLTPSGWAAESQLIHIRINGFKITSGIRVPNADYDISALTDSQGIVSFRFKGKNDEGWVLDLKIPLDEIRGAEKSLVKSKLPGSPYCFKASGPADFSATKGGVVHLQALSDWKFLLFKSYGYKNLDVEIDNESGSVRASLLDGNKAEHFSKLTINVGLIGAAIKTE